MNQIKIIQIHNEIDLKRCFSVILELRPHLNYEKFCEIYYKANEMDQYHLVAVENSGEIVAVMGYRTLYDLVRGKHTYIDDLVSTEKHRSKGFGYLLLKYAEKVASENSCQSLRLCTGLENLRGIQFYEKNGWTKRAYAYTKKI